MAEEYKLVTLNDLLSVPSEKWDALLADLRHWMELRREFAPLVDAGVVEMKEGMRWIDDGIEGLSELSVEIVESL